MKTDRMLEVGTDMEARALAALALARDVDRQREAAVADLAGVILRALTVLLPAGQIVDLSAWAKATLPPWLGAVRAIPGQDRWTKMFRIDRLVEVEPNLVHPMLSRWFAEATPVSMLDGGDGSGYAGAVKESEQGSVRLVGCIGERVPGEDSSLALVRLVQAAARMGASFPLPEAPPRPVRAVAPLASLPGPASVPAVRQRPTAEPVAAAPALLRPPVFAPPRPPVVTPPAARLQPAAVAPVPAASPVLPAAVAVPVEVPRPAAAVPTVPLPVAAVPRPASAKVPARQDEAADSLNACISFCNTAACEQYSYSKTEEGDNQWRGVIEFVAAQHVVQALGQRRYVIHDKVDAGEVRQGDRAKVQRLSGIFTSAVAYRPK